jgi:hypothetical protein
VFSRCTRQARPISVETEVMTDEMSLPRTLLQKASKSYSGETSFAIVVVLHSSRVLEPNGTLRRANAGPTTGKSSDSGLFGVVVNTVAPPSRGGCPGCQRRKKGNAKTLVLTPPATSVTVYRWRSNRLHNVGCRIHRNPRHALPCLHPGLPILTAKSLVSWTDASQVSVFARRGG